MAGIYIHIPFCKQACTYCNFHFSTSLSTKNELIEALIKEIKIRKSYLDKNIIETIYFGGGTPSILSVKEINLILQTILEEFPNLDIKEVTLEANPDDLTKTFLEELKTTIINRLSIGIQSFKEDDLRFMNRSHNAYDAEKSILLAQNKGFTNINADLIYGIPGLTDEEWESNILKLIQLNIPHISCYALTLEPKTALYHSVNKGKYPPPDEEQAARQFEILIKILNEHNYEQYEISNFSLTGKYAIHNTNYWMGKHYLGIGPSAHSYDGTSRQWNVSNNILYANSIIKERICLFEKEDLTLSDEWNEYILTSLRTIWGTDLLRLRNKFGDVHTDTLLVKCKDYLTNHFMFIKNDHIILTDAGKLFADKIAAELFL